MKRIRSAYEAWWFLYKHPKLNAKERSRVSEKEAGQLSKYSGSRVIHRKIRDYNTGETVSLILREWPIWRRAVKENLDVFYAKVNAKGFVDDDRSKNENVECWLETGPLQYMVVDGKFYLAETHDYRLDCGAPTFDEALIKLAKNVRKVYGDYDDDNE